MNVSAFPLAVVHSPPAPVQKLGCGDCFIWLLSSTWFFDGPWSLCWETGQKIPSILVQNQACLQPKHVWVRSLFNIFKSRTNVQRGLDSQDSPFALPSWEWGKKKRKCTLTAHQAKKSWPGVRDVREFCRKHKWEQKFASSPEVRNRNHTSEYEQYLLLFGVF